MSLEASGPHRMSHGAGAVELAALATGVGGRNSAVLSVLVPAALRPSLHRGEGEIA